MVVLIVSLLLALGPATQPVDAPPERAEDYVAETIAGYEIRINKALLEDETTLARARLHLAADLDEINHLLPAPALERLADVTIWVERGGEGTRNGRGLCTHWSQGWLLAHGFLPEKVGDIEIGSAADYLDWRRNQPYMLLHEFAHAYHWRLETLPSEIEEAFKQAQESGRYNAVDHNLGGPQRAYAMNNVNEYFAELSEAYFALNDFYPYTRRQLRRHDAAGLAAIEATWGVQR